MVICFNTLMSDTPEVRNTNEFVVFHFSTCFKMFTVTNYTSINHLCKIEIAQKKKINKVQLYR